VIGGNWKSNGDKKFIEEFTKDTLKNVRFNPLSMDVCVAPTDIHLLGLMKTLKDNKKDHINVMAQDVS
jgi:triosephosphate isomerase